MLCFLYRNHAMYPAATPQLASRHALVAGRARVEVILLICTLPTLVYKTRLRTVLPALHWILTWCVAFLSASSKMLMSLR